MKKIITITCFFFILFGVDAQNLVPNPSFEEYSQCPDNWTQIDRASNWISIKGSPDYFNSCNLFETFSTPINLMGVQSAKSGSSYAGLILYSRDGLDADEILGVHLNQPLEIGVKYYTSFNVVFKYNNPFGVCCAHNKIGAKFSTQEFSPSSPPSDDNSSHILSESIIADTLNWTTIFGSFIADSSYSFLMFGNFFTNPNTSIIDITPSNDFGYYFVDDICVAEDSTYCANYIFTGIEKENQSNDFILYPNPVKDFFKISQPYFKPYDLMIYNTLGQRLFYESNIISDVRRFDLSGYSAGFLIVVIQSQDQILNYKLLKR